MQYTIRRSATAGLVLAGALLLGLQACDSPAPTESRPSPDAPAARADAAAPLARALAHALDRPELRARLLEDLRDTPFPGHRIHLRSYLRGERGAAFLEAGAAGTGRSAASLRALLDSLPELQLSMPLPLDRARWTGGDSLTVVATLATAAQRTKLSSLTGYRPGGAAVEVALGRRLHDALVAIEPAEVAFGANAEARRAGAPRAGRGTIGTWSEVTLAGATAPGGARLECEEETSVTAPVREPVDCGTTGGGIAPGGLELPSGYTYQCMVGTYAAGDGDGDALLDQCEYEIANAFRPYLQTDSHDTHLGREPHWVVRRTGSYEVQAMYLMSYFYDGGRYGIGEHTGDSEFVVLTITYANGKWRLVRAYLSAHWNVWGWDSSSSRDYDVFSYPDGTFRGRPKIWVAREKHGNYHSVGKCDEGANYQDTCDAPNGYLEEVVVHPGRNLGARKNGSLYNGTQFANCVPKPGGGSSHYECFWTGNDFSGWIGLTPAAGGYEHPLNSFGF